MLCQLSVETAITRGVFAQSPQAPFDIALDQRLKKAGPEP